MKNLLFLSAAFLVILASCKKSEDGKPGGSTPTTSCLVSKVTSDAGTTSVYAYDAQNRVASVTSTDSSNSSISTLTYSGNTVTISNGSGMDLVYYLNSRGFADSMTLDFPPSNNLKGYLEYNSAGQAVKQILYGNVFGTPTEQTTIMEYANGNMVKSTVDNGTDVTVTTYTYFTDKINASKSFEEKIQFYNANTNLMSSMTRDGEITYYSYEFDANGKYTKRTTTDGSGSSYNLYEWVCK